VKLGMGGLQGYVCGRRISYWFNLVY